MADSVADLDALTETLRKSVQRFRIEEGEPVAARKPSLAEAQAGTSEGEAMSPANAERHVRDEPSPQEPVPVAATGQ